METIKVNGTIYTPMRTDGAWVEFRTTEIDEPWVGYAWRTKAWYRRHAGRKE